MSRYVSDQNKVAFIHESGTYAGSTHPELFANECTWLGQVQDLSITEAENRIENRYLGAASRDFESFVDGPIDITGTLTYNPQDFNLFAHAIGSVYEVSGGGIPQLTVTPTNSDSWQNPFVSGTGKASTLPFCFSLEDSKQTPGTNANLNRLIRGCVINTATLNLNQGEKASIDIDFMANHITYGEGTTTSIGSNDFNRPYLWEDATLQISDADGNLGSYVNTAKSITLEINQNVVAPHYINGSRNVAEPFMGNREYTLTVSADMDSTLRMFYDDFYKGGSKFSAELDMAVDPTLQGFAGSQHVVFYMSGCRVVDMDMPSPVEGINETTVTIRPRTLKMEAWQDPRYTGSANPY